MKLRISIFFASSLVIELKFIVLFFSFEVYELKSQLTKHILNPIIYYNIFIYVTYFPQCQD